MKNHHQLAFASSIAGCAMLAIAIMQPLPSVSASSKSKARGKELFATQGCAHCHGPNGVGGTKGPDLQLVRKRMNKQQLAAQIHDGGKSMPPYGDSLSTSQINDLVAYLRARRKLVPVPARPAPVATPAGSAASDPD